jgi:hypothetical protein
MTSAREQKGGGGLEAALAPILETVKQLINLPNAQKIA